MATDVKQAALALRPREAAKAIGVSARTLWGLTAPRGPIPCARVGGCVLYRIAELDAWLREQSTAKGGGDER